MKTENFGEPDFSSGEQANGQKISQAEESAKYT